MPRMRPQQRCRIVGDGCRPTGLAQRQPSGGPVAERGRDLRGIVPEMGVGQAHQRVEGAGRDAGNEDGQIEALGLGRAETRHLAREKAAIVAFEVAIAQMLDASSRR